MDASSGRSAGDFADDPGAPKVVLLELLSRDRFAQDRSISFPFISGLARDRGVPCRWLSFGYDPERQRPDRFTVGLEPGDERRLCEVLREHEATAVILSEETTTALRDAIASARPGIRTLTVGRPMWPTREALAEVLPLGSDPGASGQWHLEDAAQPRYECELANPLAREIRPFVHVAVGPECVYVRPLKRNPVFASIAAEHPDIGDACSFCSRGDTRYALSSPPVELAVRQIRAAARELPAERRTGRHIVRGAALLFELRAFADALLSEPLPPSTFLFAARIDELLRVADAMDDVLPRLAQAGHAIHIASMGAENFSPAENERFNKGISPEQVDELVRVVRRWEREWPQAFSFFEHGGFGFITFTPWTTLDDLDRNAETMERLGLQIGALFLGSRALLLPGLPITLLAERDGLVSERFEDEAMSRVVLAGCVKSPDHVELPWRFAHREVQTIYSALLRAIEPLASRLSGDPSVKPLRELAEQVAKKAGDHGVPYRTLFLGMLSAARAKPAPPTPEALLAAVLESVTKAAGVAGSSESGVDAPPRLERARGHPALLDVILTYECNLACDYCTLMARGATASPMRGRSLPTAAVVSELRRGRAERYEAVSFTGGEPTMRRDLSALVRVARDLGFAEIKIQTNGLLLAHPPNVDRLIDAGANLFNVSVHTHDPEAYDRMVRRRGAHSLMVAALENLVARGARVRADLIVTSDTYRRLPSAVRWLDSCGVRMVDFWYVSLTDENKDNVACLPRMSEAVPLMREALAIARERGMEARSLHVPRCLLGEDAVHAYDPGADRVKVVTPDSTFTLDRSKLAGRVYVPACERGCAYRQVCPGVRPDYVERHGDAEFVAVAGPAPGMPTKSDAVRAGAVS